MAGRQPLLNLGNLPVKLFNSFPLFIERMTTITISQSARRWSALVGPFRRHPLFPAVSLRHIRTQS
jgi:hypothetical protein